MGMSSHVVFPKPTSQENGYKGPVKTVYELEYECFNYVDLGETKRISAIGFLPNSKIDFKEFYHNGSAYVRVDYKYINDELSQRIERYLVGDYTFITEFIPGRKKGCWEERGYMDDALQTVEKYKQGILVESEVYNGENLVQRTRHDVENGKVHHVNEDEIHYMTGEPISRKEMDFTYENNKLKEKVYFMKDYVFYKNSYQYYNDGTLKEELSVNNGGDTIYLKHYTETGLIQWEIDTKSILNHRIKITYEYDSKKNLVSKASSSLFQNDSTWTYNNKGQLIEEIAIRDDEKVGVRTWTYENDLLVKCEGKGEENFTIQYSYDKYGNCIKEMTITENEPVHVLYRRIYYHKN